VSDDIKKCVNDVLAILARDFGVERRCGILVPGAGLTITRF
jgi:hypothetical protein